MLINIHRLRVHEVSCLFNIHKTRIEEGKGGKGRDLRERGGKNNNVTNSNLVSRSEGGLKIFVHDSTVPDVRVGMRCG